VLVVKVLESQLATRIIIAHSWGCPDEMEVKAGFLGNEATMAKESAKKNRWYWVSSTSNAMTLKPHLIEAMVA
jgi:hypothetical protein